MTPSQLRRQAASKKIKLKITRKRRCKHGYVVRLCVGNVVVTYSARTYHGALNTLAVQMRSQPTHYWSVEANTKEVL